MERPHILELKTIRIVYQALIESINSYGIFICGGAYGTSIDPLKKIQNKILKIILKKKGLKIPHKICIL
ncbi:Uncharacterized protein FWK35_00016291 [Aphis craccivora]|uniref:BPL/LPL catalytic domain-containing protein n=1 Tax=Aphis craccivora TaxID=307492 RepID=A0A6G0YUP4_APHCR|nr:Uncharacterized protein FWK35_00016291 [Aphis craccivora]